MTRGGTIVVRDNVRFDVAALERWMAVHVEGFRGPLDVAQFSSWQSNPTFRLTTPRGAYVMRRQTGGQLLKGTHAVDREARVMQALEGAGFPVPHVHALRTDTSVIGAWF